LNPLLRVDNFVDKKLEKIMGNMPKMLYLCRTRFFYEDEKGTL
jgi:hypothetical protein